MIKDILKKEKDLSEFDKAQIFMPGWLGTSKSETERVMQLFTSIKHVSKLVYMDGEPKSPWLGVSFNDDSQRSLNKMK